MTCITYIVSEKYKDALHEAQAELARLDERRAVLLRLIQNLRELSTDELYELTPPPGYIPKGLTEEIRAIMALTTVPLDAVQIRDSLVMRGVEYKSPKTLLVNVHTVLDRISDELDIVEREDGKRAYKAKANSRLVDLVRAWGNVPERPTMLEMLAKLGDQPDDTKKALEPRELKEKLEKARKSLPRLDAK